MLFLVISTKKRFQKSNCKRKDPEWVYGTRGQKKPNRQKKSPVLYNKTQQKKHVIYSTRWTEKKRDFPYIFHSKICLFYATFCDHFLCLVKKNFKEKKINSQYLSVLCAKKKIWYFCLLLVIMILLKKKNTLCSTKNNIPLLSKRKIRSFFFKKTHHYYLGLFLLNFFLDLLYY